jgi:formimidoylglutamate deiminase
VGETLLDAVHASASNATGLDGAGDRVVLEADAPQFAGATPADVVDRWIFCGNGPLVGAVPVAGARAVADGRHRDRDAIAARYRTAMAELLA